MFKETDLVLDTVSVPSNISYRSFKTYNLPMKNSCCDHRNFNNVNMLNSSLALLDVISWTYKDHIGSFHAVSSM